MLKIKQFTIDSKAQSLTIALSSSDMAINETWQFSFEFLRVITLEQQPISSLVTHKKQVQLLRIEAVAQHGYRFCFDDDYSVMYHQDQLTLLHNQSNQLWQHYLQTLKKSGHTREPTIDIQQL